MKKIADPRDSLKQGNWFKLICGASYQYLPAIRNLALAYTLAGADCIDIAADKAVISAARAGMKVAYDIDSKYTKINGKSFSKYMIDQN